MVCFIFRLLHSIALFKIDQRKTNESDYITIDSQLDAQAFFTEMLSIGVIAYLIVFLPTSNLSMPIFPCHKSMKFISIENYSFYSSKRVKKRIEIFSQERQFW